MKSILWLLLYILLMLTPVSVLAVENKKISEEKIITLDFKNIAVRELLQFITEAMGFNIIMGESVAGVVSLHFKDITWVQALNVVLEMSGLVKKQQQNILLIGTPAEFAIRQKSLEAAASVDQIKIKLRHTSADEVGILVKSQPELISSSGSVQINPVENSLWIKDRVDNLPTIVQYIKEVDVPAKQILITAKIINIDNSKVSELGVQFDELPAKNNPEELNVSLPRSQKGGLNIAFANFVQNQLINMQLDALEISGHTKIIADPRLITQNRKTATIESGEEVPYQEKTASGATNVTFKKAALSLKVTPSVLPDQRISLILEISQNKVSPLAVNGTPAIKTQEIKTEVIVHEGETVILGGIFESSTSTAVNSIPLVNKVPVIGHLLSHHNKNMAKKELMIFVSPHVVAE